MCSWIYHLPCKKIKLNPAVCKQTKSTCFQMGKKAGRKIRSQLSGTPYQYTIWRANLFIMMWEARGGMGKGGQHFPVTLQSTVTSPQPQLLEEMQCWPEFQLKFIPGNSNGWSLFSSRLMPGCWLNYFQCFYHNSASRVHPSVMTVWKLTEKRTFNWEVDLGLSFVGSLMHRLSSHCIL